MNLSLHLLLFISILSFNLKAQRIKFLFGNLSDKNLGVTYNYLSNTTNTQSIHNLGYAMYYYEKEEWDSSLHYFNKLFAKGFCFSQKKYDFLNRYFLDSTRVVHLRQEVQLRVFERIKSAPTIPVINSFLENNWDFFQKDKAELIRDEIALNSALENGSASFIDSFILNYPSSILIPKAKKLSCLKQYNDMTPNKTLEELFNYFTTYENGCMVDTAKKTFIIKCKEANNSTNLIKFISYEENGLYYEKAWRELYSIEVKFYEKIQLQNFLKKFPEYPYKDEIDLAIQRIEEQVYPYYKSQKYGYMNKLGQSIIQSIFEEVEPFKNGLGIVGNNDKYGAIDKQGKIVVPIKYDGLYAFENDYAIFIMNDLYGILNKWGQIILEPKFEEISKLNNRFFQISTDNGYCLFDLSIGKQLSGEYDELSNEHGLIRVKNNNKFNVILDTNSFLFQTWCDNLYIINDTLFVVCSNDQLSIINNRIETKIEVEWDEIVMLGDSNKILACRQDDKVVLIGMDGKMLGSMMMKAEEFQNLKGLNGQLSYPKKGKFGVVNIRGHIIADFVYNQIFLNESFICARKDDRWLLMKSSGELIPDLSESYIECLTKHFFVIERNQKQMVYNAVDASIISNPYDQIKSLNSNVMLIENNGFYGLMDILGNELLTCKYQNIKPFDENVFACNIGEELQYYNCLTNELIKLSAE